MPDLFIIAGPNGAGKTTASYTILPDILGISQFVNADEIAKGLSPFDPGSVDIQAGKIMLNRIHSLMAESSDFAFETTLATKSYLNLIEKAHSNNYKITLVFFYLESFELAIERVKTRVAEGGHTIPIETIKRRYLKGLENLNKLYLNVVDSWKIFDNSHNQIIFVAEGNIENQILIYNQETWNKIIKS